MSFDDQKIYLKNELSVSTMDIRNGTWHHCPETGHFQLVDFDVHNEFKHTGGNTIWGDKNK